MSELSKTRKLLNSERWTHFLESTALGLQVNLTLLVTETATQISRPNVCPDCGANTPGMSALEIETVLASSERPFLAADTVFMLPLRSGLVMVARECGCRKNNWQTSLKDRAEIAQKLLISFQTALTESLTGGQRASELIALRQLNQTLLSLFRGSSNAMEQTFDLILSALVILTESQGSWLDFKCAGTSYHQTKGDQEAIQRFLANAKGDGIHIKLQGKERTGQLGVIAPADAELAHSMLSLFAEECIIISEIAELFQLFLSHYGLVLGCIGSAVLLLNQTKHIIYANYAAGKLFDCNSMELLGKDIHTIHAPWNLALQSQPQYYTKGTMEPIGLADTLRWVDWQLCPMRSADSCAGWVILADDRTDYYNWQETGRRAEQLTLTATLVGSLAHELRNPISAAKGLLQLSTRRQADRTTSYNDLVLRELDRVTRLLNEFLLMGRLDRRTSESINICDFVTELLPLLQGETAGTNIKILTDFHKIPAVQFDHGQLTQVILNLVRNAIDATDSNGCITLRTRVANEGVLFEVQDQGPGIPADVAEKLFQPFFTTKERGTGLGLAVTHSIINSHHGEITFRNAEERGAVFSVFIPAEQTPLGKNTDVIIVSQDELLCFPIEKTLLKAGLATESTRSLQEALERCKQAHASVLILTDLTDTLYFQIKTSCPKTRIICIGNQTDKVATDIVYMQKPVNYAKLIESVQDILRIF